MEKKVLGKIASAKFGEVSDYPFLMGLLLDFSLDGGHSGVGDGGKFTINMSEDCEWTTKEERRIAIEELADAIYKLLNDAKVCTVDQLKNKPVEVTLENNTFKDFRILTEVL